MKLTDGEIERWKRDLDSGDKWREAEAAEVLSESFSTDDTDHIITACDYLWREIDRIGDFIELTYTIPRNLAPQATLTIKADHHLVPLFRTCTQTMVGITIETAGISEAFYVKRHREKLGPDGVWTHVLELVGIYDILNYLVIWPSWYLPIQSQPFSHAIYAAPICTAIEAMAAEQSLRIQSGMWEFVNNFLSGNPDVRSYFGTVLQAIKRDGKPSTILKTPLYVVRTGLLRDSSQIYVKTVRMQTVGQIITEITAAYGVDVRVHLWRPGDPQPDRWANLEVPTYVMTVRDRTQIEGPTKSILDSALRLVVDVQGSLLGNTLAPLLNPDGKYAPEGLYIAPRLGINFVMPYAMIVTPDNVITEDGDVVRERSPLVSCEIAHNTPLGWQHIIGGKSPKWLNDLINAFFAYVIDVAMIVIGFTGVPSNLLDGFMNVGAPPGNWGGTDIQKETIPFLPSNSSSTTRGATVSARTTRPSRCSPPPTAPRTTSRPCSSSSKCFGTAGVTPRRLRRSVARTARTSWAETSSQERCSSWCTRPARSSTPTTSSWSAARSTATRVS